VVDPGVDRTD